LFGYGGFEISLTPSYTPILGAGWLNDGGCYAIANIRGGGEFGPKWHQAALKENRNLCYDDFIAVAENLIERNITQPKHLGIRGGSNGGLLMGNMMVRRPDLFGAICNAVPLLDMKRYNKLLAGASWMAEYGNPDTDDWEYLQKYSAYHNIDPVNAAKTYPPLLMTSSTRDDRVHPYHGRAFVKRLLELKEMSVEGCDNVYFYENIEGGHGGAADTKQQAFMNVLYIEFLWNTIGKYIKR
jgi:prolyl oligopeptidase